MARLPSPHKENVEALIQKSFDSFRESIDKGIETMVDAFDAIPEPRNNWGETYEVARNLMAANFRSGKIAESEKWLAVFMVADPDRPNVGEREMWAGKIAFEKNDMVEAKKYFTIANTKSEGRAFKGEDQKYFKFFKSK